MVYVFIADGSEEIESITPIDFLRRANLEVKVVKIGDGRQVTGSRNIKIEADINESELDLNNLGNLEMIVLPGGAVGVENLYNSETVRKIIEHCVLNNIKISAICAAPSILARFGYLKDKKSTAYLSFQHYLIENGAIPADEPVVTDGIFTTAWGVLASIDFAVELVRVLKGEDLAGKIGK